MFLRSAVFDDWKMLLDWRNDDETRRNSHTPDMIDKINHKKWLRAVLADKHQQLYIAIDNGIPMGTVKADFDHYTDIHKLSWTTSPDVRGKGVGKKMVKLMVERIDAKVRAEIKEGNIASVRIAENAGLKLQKLEKGILHYSNY